MTLLTCKATSVKVKDLFGKLPHPRKKEISRCLVNKSQARSKLWGMLPFSYCPNLLQSVVEGLPESDCLCNVMYMYVLAHDWFFFMNASNHFLNTSVFLASCSHEFHGLIMVIEQHSPNHLQLALGSQEGLWVGWFAELESSCIWIISKLACFSVTYIWILMSVIWWVWEQVWLLVSGCLWV